MVIAVKRKLRGQAIVSREIDPGTERRGSHCRAASAAFFTMGAVLGYLAAGASSMRLHSWPLYQLDSVESILHFGESACLLLFMIGLELRPVGSGPCAGRSRAGLGPARGLVLGACCHRPFARPWARPGAFLRACPLAVLDRLRAQVLDEKGELTARHGRLAFAILLLRTSRPSRGSRSCRCSLWRLRGAGHGLDGGILALLIIVAVIVVGHLLLDRVYRLVAATGVREAMTAAALLTVGA